MRRSNNIALRNYLRGTAVPEHHCSAVQTCNSYMVVAL